MLNINTHETQGSILLIKNILVPEKEGTSAKDILIDNNGYIIKIVDCEYSSKHKNDEKYYDGTDKYLIPGFIDCHTHGFSGFHSEGSFQDLRKLSIQYAIRGTLGFFATIGPRTFEEYKIIAEQYRLAFHNGEYEGARFLGLHLEGPFLSPEKAGAINPEKMYGINLSDLDKFLKEQQDIIRIITLAPELPNAAEAVKLMRKYSITASMGHTNAVYKEAMKGIEAGITHMTHTFNAMRAFNHRETGVLGAAFLNDQVYCELIGDGVHVSKEAVLVLMKLKGLDKIMAVSDGGISCGIDYPEGYRFEDGDFIVNGAVYSSDGKMLCGSTRDVYSHFKSFIKEYDLNIFEASKLTSRNAAEHFSLGLGKIEEGSRANLLVIDEELNILSIIIDGKITDGFLA